MARTRTNRTRKPRKDRDPDIIYKKVTETVLEQLEKGVAPWNKPWIGNGGEHGNLLSGKQYHGVNQLLCWCYCEQNGWRSSKWVTYKGAEKLGGNVKKGEKGNYITFWKFYDKKDEDGNVIKDEDPNAWRRAFLKVYRIFNVEQCEGLEEHLKPAPPAPKLDRRLPYMESFIKATGANISYGGDRACYSSSTDAIRLPELQAYMDVDAKNAVGAYYATALHELGHWTGHGSRLDRKMGNGFGSEDYAREELVAEMTSAFLCSRLRLPGNLQHPEYIGSWIKVLKSDPKALIRAASKARRAADFIVDAARAGKRGAA